MLVNITDIKRFALFDGKGIRSTVFFKGCPLNCVWCHNPENINSNVELAYFSENCTNCGNCAEICNCHKVNNNSHEFLRNSCTLCGKCAENCPSSALTVFGKMVETEDICNILLEDKLFYDTSRGGITLSRGECLLQPDACKYILSKMKELGVSTAVDTSGFVSKNAIDTVLPFTDIFLYDIKAFNEETHIKCTGKSNKIILENLKYINSCGNEIEIRIPYVPEYNSGEMADIANFVKPLKNVSAIRMLSYHKLSGGKLKAIGNKQELPSKIPTEKEIKYAADILSKSGKKIII